MNNKGNIGNVQTVGVLLVVIVMVAIVGIIGSNLFSEFNSDVQEGFDSEIAKNTSQNFQNDVPGVVDNIVVFLFAGLVLFFVISSYFSSVSPFALIASVIILIILALLPIILSSVWEEVTLSPEFSDEVDVFSNSNFIISNYGSLFVGFFILGIISSIVGSRRGTT